MSVRVNNPHAARLAQQLLKRLMVKELPPTYAQQHEFVMTEAHHAAFVAGIGSGKSWAGALRAWRAAHGWIGEKRIPVPNLGMFTAPTEDMIRKASLRSFLEIAELMGEPITHEMHNKNEKLIKLKNGSEIYYASTQYPDRLRGPSLTWYWGDEAAMYTPDVRPIMIGRLRQHGQLGYDWYSTTPRGRNWVFRVFLVEHPNHPDYFIVKASSRDNRFIDAAIVDAWAQEYVGDFAAQELDAEFVAFEGLIYSEFDRARHVRRAVGQYPRYVAGVDWGFANPGVIVLLGVDGDGRAAVVQELYERSRRIEEWVSMAVQLRGIYRIERFYCDPANPDNIKAFVAAGLPAEPADNTVQTGIQMVKARLVPRADGEPRLTIHHDAINLIDEFESYQWAKNVHGLRDEPLKTHDHAMDALRYAVMGLDHPKVRKIEAKTTSWIG